MVVTEDDPIKFINMHITNYPPKGKSKKGKNIPL